MGNTCNLWRIHVDIWQNQYNIVMLKKKNKKNANNNHFKWLGIVKNNTKIISLLEFTLKNTFLMNSYLC